MMASILEHIRELPHIDLSIAEWDSLTEHRSQLPICCGTISALAVAIRKVRSFDLDIDSAQDVLEAYEAVCMQHDMSMFKTLDKIIFACQNFVGDYLKDKEKRGLAYYDCDWYDEQYGGYGC